MSGPTSLPFRSQLTCPEITDDICAMFAGDGFIPASALARSQSYDF
jgi:hypothetical protein